jgi:hypothetical protein
MVGAKGYGQRIGILLLVTSTTRFYKGVGVHLKNTTRVSPFRDLLRPIPNPSVRPFSPGVRESIPVTISFDLLRKRRIMMEKV